MGTLNRMGLLAATLGLAALAGHSIPVDMGTDDRRHYYPARHRGGRPTSEPSKAKARENRVKKARLAKKSRAKNRGR